MATAKSYLFRARTAMKCRRAPWLLSGVRPSCPNTYSAREPLADALAALRLGALSRGWGARGARPSQEIVWGAPTACHTASPRLRHALPSRPPGSSELPGLNQRLTRRPSENRAVGDILLLLTRIGARRPFRKHGPGARLAEPDDASCLFRLAKGAVRPFRHVRSPRRPESAPAPRFARTPGAPLPLPPHGPFS